jgi:serine/threonine protein phosphatase PrpC
MTKGEKGLSKGLVNKGLVNKGLVNKMVEELAIEGIEMLCPACSAEVPEDDSFCEACGTRVRAALAQTGGCACGADAEEIDEEGFCQGCGKRVRRPASDHIEQAISAAFAAVSDRGVKHDRNEDRCAIAEGESGFGVGHAMVVCDGVSGSRKSEVASAAVSEGVLASLVEAMRYGVLDASAAMSAAIKAGMAELASRIAKATANDPPSTTVVAAMVLDGHVTVGWVGDSRAYWFDATGARQLTEDHSWINAVVAEGAMSAEQAEKSPLAHGITRWIGVDAGENAEADIVGFAVQGPGTLLLCSDGLWNYAQRPEAMAETLHQASANGEDALGTARRLVEFAIEKGGHDNITVAVMRLDGMPIAGLNKTAGETVSTSVDEFVAE